MGKGQGGVVMRGGVRSRGSRAQGWANGEACRLRTEPSAWAPDGAGPASKNLTTSASALGEIGD